MEALCLMSHYVDWYKPVTRVPPNARKKCFCFLLFWFGIVADRLSSLVAKDIGVTSVEDGHGGAAEELTAGSAELNLLGEEYM